MFLSFNFSFHKGNSNAVIGTRARDSHRCSSSREGSPAGYSRLSLECIKGCARNYRCTYGRYHLLGNKCHKFANCLSAVLCTTGKTCPSWCRGSCNHAEAGQTHSTPISVKFCVVPTLKISKAYLIFTSIFKTVSGHSECPYFQENGIEIAHPNPNNSLHRNYKTEKMGHTG